MTNPKIRKNIPAEQAALDAAHLQTTVKFRKFDIKKFEWNIDKPKTVLLIHGWQGNSGNFGGIIPLLVEAGYHVVAFDAPSHGRSSRGKTHIFEYSDFLVEELNTLKPHKIISYSLGSCAAAIAIQAHPELYIENWLMITTPHTFDKYIEHMAKKLSINSKTIDTIIRTMEKDMNQSLSDMNMTLYCERCTNVEQATIVSGTRDKLFPVEWARNTYKGFNGNCKLYEIDQGHYSITWSDEVKEILRERFLEPALV